MCEPVTAGAALASAAGGAGATAAATSTFLGVSSATWAGISTAATVGGTLMSAMNASQQASSQRAALNMQAEAAQRDAMNADLAAHRESEKGDREAMRIGRQQADMRGRQKAATAANGIDITYGSADATLAQTDYYGWADQATARQNADDADYSLRDRASQLRSTGSYSASAADRINPWASAGGTLLAGAGKVAERWSTWKN